MKRGLIVGLIIALGILITIIEIRAIKNANHLEMHTVILAKEAIETGEMIQDKHLIEAEIPISLWQESYFSEKEDLIGHYVKNNFESKEIFSKHRVVRSEEILPKKGQAMTALKLLPEEALCFSIKVGDVVGVYWVDENEGIMLGNVIVKAIYDHYLSEGQVPVFVLIEGSKTIISTVINERRNGQIELVKWSE